ncbi:hypothetical protein BH11MYX2_BH11MYX2_37620 [soil metagenome]
MKWLFVILLVPAPAFAFSDPATFAEAAIDGGGGGRYFTGSHVEGYSCNVCHQGGGTAKFVVDPLPDTLVAGTRYSLVVHWTNPEVPHALQLELVTPNGGNPTVTIPADAALPPESRCDSKASGLPAVYSVSLGVRRIIGVEDCGASRVEVSFVATGEPIDVSIGGVIGNDDGTANGDAVFDDRFTLSQSLKASGSGCASSDGATLLIPLLAWLRLRRRRQGSSTPSNAVTSRAQT